MTYKQAMRELRIIFHKTRLTSGIYVPVIIIETLLNQFDTENKDKEAME